MSCARDRDAVRFFGGEWRSKDPDIVYVAIREDGARTAYAPFKLMEFACDSRATWGQLRRLASRIYDFEATHTRVIEEALADAQEILLPAEAEQVLAST